MTVTIQISNDTELSDLLRLLASMKFPSITVKGASPSVQRGNKKINPRALFGMWSDSPRSIEDCRKNAWQRDWTL